MRRRSFVSSHSLLATCAFISIACSTVQAHAEDYRFNIPSQSVSGALQLFAKQSGYRLLFPSRSVTDLRSKPLTGSLSAEDALNLLLSDTPLRIASIRGKVIALTARKGEAMAISRFTPGRQIQLAALQPAVGMLPEAAEAPIRPADEIVVVGSQIRGAKTTGALPVSVVGKEDIAAIGAVSANDLFRTLPQASDMTFNEQTLGGGSPNAARGDVASVSLRGLEQGNTLVLLNGRRMVLHPTSQTSNGTPVLTYNVNAIPVGGLERVEVLRDGAAALYGSDAVAGVVNNVLSTDFTGLSLDATYGGAEGTGMREFQLNGKYGSNFAGGRGNISLMANFTRRTALEVGDQDYTATNDLRSFVEGTAFEGNTAFDTRSTSSSWGAFRTQNGSAVRSNGTLVTSAAGVFHIQPQTNAGCQINLSTAPGICIDDGVITGAADRNLRADNSASFPDITVTPSTTRFNVFSFINYELSDSIKFFSELGYYRAKSKGYTTPGTLLSTTPITISSSAYWNPFGAVGSANRLPGIDAPAEGLNLTTVNLSIRDAGMRQVNVTNQEFRLLGGVKGEMGNWDWESAALYSEATVKDSGDAISNSLLQAAINRTTADAYNPFNGGDPTNPSGLDTTPSAQSTIDSFIVTSTRRNKTTLALWDAKASNAQLIDIWGAPIGIAAGIEFRRETYKDDRDALQDGSAPFVDSVTGVSYSSDLLGASYRPDIYGKRSVFSAYAELAVPVFTPEMEIPMFHALEFQLAGRYERYSDVGDVAKPKLAGFWDLLDGIRLRGSISGGFRAPNLEVINTSVSEGVNSRTDYVQCEADLRAGRISSFSGCTRSFAVQQRRDGNSELKPEESTSWSLGAVLTPPLPGGLGKVTLTVDRWRIKQKGSVGILSDATEIALDYLARVNGSSNPNVVRAAATADDIARYAGTGITPTGDILYVDSRYENLLPLDVQGIDFGFNYASPTTPVGRFTLSFNASKLIKYYQSASAQVQSLLDAIAGGEINSAIGVTGAADLVRQNGHPRWRYSGTLTWYKGPVQVGLFTQYIGSVEQSTVFDANANPYVVDSQLTGNLYAQYTLKKDGLGGTTSIQLGVRNFTNERPPLATSGYLASLYQPQRRYWYATIRKSF